MGHLFSLNAEGGPLLCLDAYTAVRWKGTEDGSQDYADLCTVLDAEPQFSAAVMPIAGELGVVWEMQGAGTADIFAYADGRIIIVRTWLNEGADERLEALADCEATSQLKIGLIDLPSRVLAVLWAVESGIRIPAQIDVAFKQVGGTAIAGSVFAIKTTTTHYRCSDDKVTLGQSTARRLTLTPC